MQKTTSRLFSNVDTTQIPDLLNSDSHDPIVYAHFYHPINPTAHWLITELDPKDNMAFGYVSLFNDYNNELGYISIDELESINIHGYTVQQDQFFKPCTLSIAKENLKIN